MMVDINNGKTRAEELLELNAIRRSRSEEFMRKKAAVSGIPEISNKMARSVSDERRELMELQLEAGEFREQGSGFSHSGREDRSKIKMVQTHAGLATHNGKNIYKTASGMSVSSGSSGFRGSNDTTRQTPEVYSPLWLNSNLNLPRDRAAINAWSRSFFALNPIVHNAISLHSTYPISKLNIKSKDPKVERFFSQMIEEIDLMNMAVLAAQEFWTLGEAFIHAELDESKGKWSRLMILNPDYVNVQRSVIAAEPIISLRPDENLRRVVTGNQPSDIQQRKQLDPSVIEHVLRNENIPLNNFYVHHMARRISPYEIRGTGLIVSCFRALMLGDKLRESKYAQADNMVNPLTLVKVGNQEFRPSPVDLEHIKNVFEECYDEETEVLTNKGFQKFNDIVEYQCVMDGTTGQPHYYPYMKSGASAGVETKIACFNKDTESIEYHVPERITSYDYEGDVIRVSARNLDIKVTPNHDMWVKGSSSKWSKVKAEKLLPKTMYRTRSIAGFEGEKPEFINVLGADIPVTLYLEFLGYLLSEGSVESRKYDYTSINELCFTQSIGSPYVDDMRDIVTRFSSFLDLVPYERRKTPSGDIYKEQPEDVIHFHIRSKKLVSYFKDLLGMDSINSKNKTIPREILDLDPSLLQSLLKTMVNGDGSRIKNKSSSAFRYFTSSQELANNVQELVFKCGYSSNIISRKREKKYKNKNFFGNKYISNEYIVSWSDAADGKYPSTYGNVTKEYYKGKVWCFTVPTGLFVTRRNGKITIQGNCQYDKDFKIFTHDAVNVERIGYGQGIYDTSNDVQQLIKEIYIGLMVPSVIMDGSDTTYATGSIALDVLRQRYMQFRQMMTSWLKRKIFAPISQINDFYEYVDGEKQLIVPEIDWNHMSLFDMDSYINNMVNLSQGEGAQKRVSTQTLYRSLGLEYEEEQRKIRYEDIQDAIRTREIMALQRYSIHELKSLGPGDEIEEVADEPVPGQSPYEPEQSGASGGGLPGAGPMGIGGGGMKLPGAPPPSPIGGGAKPPPAP